MHSPVEVSVFRPFTSRTAKYAALTAAVAGMLTLSGAPAFAAGAAGSRPAVKSQGDPDWRIEGTTRNQTDATLINGDLYTENGTVVTAPQGTLGAHSPDKWHVNSTSQDADKL